MNEIQAAICSSRSWGCGSDSATSSPVIINRKSIKQTIEWCSVTASDHVLKSGRFTMKTRQELKGLRRTTRLSDERKIVNEGRMEG